MTRVQRDLMQMVQTDDFGTTLRELRESVGVTHQWLAWHIGVSESTVRNWEHRRSSPSVRKLRKIAEVIDEARRTKHSVKGAFLSVTEPADAGWPMVRRTEDVPVAS